jgi:hypothetical protein
VVKHASSKWKTLGSTPSTIKKKKKKRSGDQGWKWCTSVIPAFKRLRQEDHKFKDNLGYTEKC